MAHSLCPGARLWRTAPLPRFGGRLRRSVSGVSQNRYIADSCQLSHMQLSGIWHPAVRAGIVVKELTYAHAYAPHFSRRYAPGFHQKQSKRQKESGARAPGDPPAQLVPHRYVAKELTWEPCHKTLNHDQRESSSERLFSLCYFLLYRGILREGAKKINFVTFRGKNAVSGTSSDLAPQALMSR